MKNLIQYTYSCTNIMFKFLKQQCDETELITKLKEIESLAKNESNKKGSLWFKFGLTDTLATTISDIETDLKDKNKTFLIERFESVIGLNPDDELQVYFS